MDLSDLSAECACSHKIESLKFILKSKGYEIKSIWDVAIVASQFSCSNCTKNDCKIYDNNKS